MYERFARLAAPEAHRCLASGPRRVPYDTSCDSARTGLLAAATFVSSGMYGSACSSEESGTWQRCREIVDDSDSKTSCGNEESANLVAIDAFILLSSLANSQKLQNGSSRHAITNFILPRHNSFRDLPSYAQTILF
jgi:hypothetical protein